MNFFGSPSCSRFARLTGAWLPMMFCMILSGRLLAQGPGSESPPIAPVAPPSVRPVLVDVEFEGNDMLSGEQIQAEIATRPTRTPAIMKVFALIGQLVERNPLAPQRYRDQVRRTIDSLGGDFRYLNMSLVEEDTARIAKLYDDYGHHEAVVRYRVRLDTVRNTSIVRFIINEGPSSPVKGVHYFGLDDVPEDIRREATEPEFLKDGETYTKAKYVEQVDQVLTVLHNNGYAFAAAAEPIVLNARPPIVENRFDSVLIYIYPGNRYRFGRTYVEPDTISGSRQVDTMLIRDQREYEWRDWYSRQQVDQTIANLYALGTFDLVTLDTIAVASTDSTLSMVISTRHREQNDLRIAPEISFEQRVSEYVTNLGLSASYTRLNVLGRAEQLNISGRLLTPTRNLLSFNDFKKEFQGGAAVSFSVPSAVGFPLIGSKRLSWLLTLGYDFDVLDRLRKPKDDVVLRDVTLRSQRLYGAGEITYRFPTHTYLDLVSARLSYQYNKYFGIGDYIDQIAERRVRADSRRIAERRCDAGEVKTAVEDALRDNLYHVQVLQGDDPNLLGPTENVARENFDALKRNIILSGTLIADNRDDFFSPTKGDLFEARGEVGVNGGFLTGVPGGFVKLEGSYRRYGPWKTGWIWAYRAHMGYIQEFGLLPLTPVSSRFSAGGSNSLRGWYARDMLATRPPVVAAQAGVDALCAEPIVENIVSENRRLLGGLALLELNAEMRWKPFYNPSSSTLGRQLNQVVLVFFIDAGNAYFRDGEDIKNFSAKEILENIGLATGFSIGYETPVGPFRFGLGFPIYDPVNVSSGDKTHRWIFRRNVPDAAVLHVGIGHAF